METNRSKGTIFSIKQPSIVTNEMKAPRSSRSDGYKNPILGIEVRLMKQLQEIDTDYHGASIQKKRILVEALEALAATNMGFKKQFKYVIELLQPNTRNVEQERMKTVTDLIRLQDELTIEKQKKNLMTSEIEALKLELFNLQEENKQIIEETNQMKQKLFNQSEYFSKSRQLSNEIQQLQESFNTMFKTKVDDNGTGKIAELLKENEVLRKEMNRLKYELEIATQITKRLKFLDQKYG